MAVLRVLTWNLMHGRAIPPARRELFPEFAEALASWPWDVALTQEVPPWWPEQLARRLRCEQRLVLTSRNTGLLLRRALARRWPDLIKSSGGGCNAILLRRGPIGEHRTRRLRWLPERRWLQAVRLGDSRWIGNVHLTVHNEDAARAEAAVAAMTLRDWSGGRGAVLGGDFNVRGLELDGLEHAGGHDVDHVFTTGIGGAATTEVLDSGTLSDHAPVLVSVG